MSERYILETNNQASGHFKKSKFVSNFKRVMNNSMYLYETLRNSNSSDKKIILKSLCQESYDRL